MATYDSVLAKNRKDQNAKAEKEYTKRAAANTKITNTYISDMNTIVDSAAENSAGKIQREIDALPTAYQSAFDANAIQQKINERNVRENMANLGMTDSGLNRTQQTAINIQRANADAALVQQKNAASNSLKQQIADIYASAENQKLEYAAKANADLKEKNESLRQGLFDTAENNAITIANNWLDNETAKQKAIIEQETANAKAEWDYKTETEKARINAAAKVDEAKINKMLDSGDYELDDSGNMVPLINQTPGTVKIDGFNSYYQQFGEARFGENIGKRFSTTEYENFKRGIGMFRGAQGQLAYITDALSEGKITEQQYTKLLKEYNIA